jgi:hypothetical protein
MMTRTAAGEGEAAELPFQEEPSKRYVGNWCVLAAAASTQLPYGGGWLLSPERCGLGRRLRRFCSEVLGGVRNIWRRLAERTVCKKATPLRSS